MLSWLVLSLTSPCMRSPHMKARSLPVMCVLQFFLYFFHLIFFKFYIVKFITLPIYEAVASDLKGMYLLVSPLLPILSHPRAVDEEVLLSRWSSSDPAPVAQPAQDPKCNSSSAHGAPSPVFPLTPSCGSAQCPGLCLLQSARLRAIPRPVG